MSVDGVVKVTTTNPASNAEGFAVRQVGIDSAQAAADGIANPTTIQIMAHGLSWNGTTWDRARGNLDVAALAYLTRTAASSSSDIISYNHRGVHIYLNFLSVENADVMLSVQGKDVNTSAYYGIFTAASVSVAGSYIYKIYPGISAGPASINDLLPRTFRVTVAHAGTSPTCAYAVGVSLIK